MGHQFGAHHTFNGTADNCAGINRYSATAVEPGSGSTIMAYAGICTPQNVQLNSDAYFHGISIDEISNFVLNGAGQCGVQSTFTDNTAAPVVNAGNDYTIPKSTAFILAGSATDADGDALTYCWEQIDNEVVNISIPPSSTQTVGAVFRSLPPKTEQYRFIPSLSEVIYGNLYPTWEVIPDVSRIMNFKLTVRDNAPGEGQTASDKMMVTVNAAAGPFKVTSQNSDNIVWLPGTSQTITWDVAGTTGNGINTARVNIILSLDGGLTFSEVLALNTPNDGQQVITVPNTPSSNVRIMVAADGNIFYALNSKKLTIGSYETTCSFYNSTNVPKSITDNNITGIISTLNVPDDFTLSDVNVSVTIDHTWIADLQIYLIAPDGTEVLIYNQSCEPGIQRENINAVFDDDADTVVCDNANPAVWGTTKPDNLLAPFNGISSYGTWKLKVVDYASGDIGTLKSWYLQLCETNPTAHVNETFFKSLAIYPNPFNDIVHVVFGNLLNDEVFVRVFDLQGRIVYQENFSKQTYHFDENIDLSKLSSGVYMLQIGSASNKVSRKIVKY